MDPQRGEKLLDLRDSGKDREREKNEERAREIER